MKILVIEDEPLTRENIALILRMEGYDTCTASDGGKGIAAAISEKPDLILCDITMPDTDGYSVLTQVRRNENLRHTPFIFLTARGDRADLRQGMNLGADDYLTKPASAAEIIDAIRARLQRETMRESGFSPDFSSPEPLQKLGITPREAEVLLWVAQGKSNGEIGAIIQATENTVKKHVQHIFEKLGVESRNAASLIALEKLSS
ncbi:response regulator transcription factor [Brevifollis gellanilyticus]|uniref:DNA-binding response regulator n=1 Tax=Brevifollis gellanilyticus TaxID=748831 RepID=A0A512M3E9_9BACT|nr:response regulator transcription factor [Brevifollis gellanilyticus]GEP41274.1 DNA-binding response regulator [Brevifollis gellanilyticus]